VGLSEDVLISRSKQGDVRAFEQLVEQYDKHVYTIAYRFMGNHEDASDLAQDAFVRAFQSISNFRGDSSFKTWIYHIITNICRDELRKRKKRQTISLDEPLFTEEGEMQRQTEDWTYAPERVFEEKEGETRIHHIIQSLSPEYRMVVVMREIQGLSYDEIAAHLGCSLGTVKSRLSRARIALRDRLRAEMELSPALSRLMS